MSFLRVIRGYLPVFCISKVGLTRTHSDFTDFGSPVSKPAGRGHPPNGGERHGRRAARFRFSKVGLTRTDSDFWLLNPNSEVGTRNPRPELK